MFQSACAKYWNWQCSIGGGSSSHAGKIFGMGCLLSENYILSARHVWTGIQREYEWPVILKYDGLFKCEIAFESEEQDVILLKTVQKVKETSSGQPTGSPKLSRKKMSVGDSVGFISHLKLFDVQNVKRGHTCFSHGYVAFFLQNTSPGVRYAISSTVIQKGFSGSPVFYADCSLSGVLVETVSFRADLHEEGAPIYKLPVVAPIFPIFDQLSSIVSQE